MLAFSAAGVAAPATAEVQSVTLTQAFAFLQNYYGVAPGKRDRFHLAYYAVLNRRFAPDLKATIVTADGKRTQVVLGRDARVEALPSLAELRSAATLEFDAPSGAKAGFALALEPNVPVGAKLDAKALAASIAQVEADVVSMAGMLSFVAPKITCALFPGAGAGQAELDNGRMAALPTDNNRFWGAAPYYEPATLAGAHTIDLAKAPSRILLAQHPK